VRYQVCYARAPEGGAEEKEGTGERAKDKEAARAVGGKATGAWVIGG
jgi:hypothetical protein